MSNTAQTTTTVSTVDVDIDSWLGAPGAESIVTAPSNESKKPSLFSNAKTDVAFLDTPGADVDETKKEEIKNVEVPRETSTADLKDLDEELLNMPEEDEKSKSGRPRTDKNGLVTFLKKRIEEKEMFAFDDYDDSKQSLEDYLGSLSEKDIDELWKANIDNIRTEVAQQTPKEFFESLPDELQYAAKYVMDGGQDLKGLFQALGQVQQVRELNVEQESDREIIVRNYLQATNFGDAEEIEEEITTWKDLGVLEKKAKQFKPKLDQMQEEIVQAQLAEQEQRKMQQQQAAQAYQKNVFEALRPGEINGLKLDRKTQEQLYTGLVQPQYPSISGRPTNLLGHLLEKHQFVEPNYPLIAEALWLLSDPDAYRKSLVNQGKNQATEQTVRQLKTEQSRRISSTMQEEDEGRQPSRRIPKPANIFKR